jgi:excisionase family DNA binding protein
MARREMISTAQATARLGVSTATIRNYVANGKITAYRVGSRLLKFDVADVDALRQAVNDW